MNGTNVQCLVDNLKGKYNGNKYRVIPMATYEIIVETIKKVDVC